jgi:hypothetical protein
MYEFDIGNAPWSDYPKFIGWCIENCKDWDITYQDIEVSDHEKSGVIQIPNSIVINNKEDALAFTLRFCCRVVDD